MNRQRQKEHGSELPAKRNPDLIITGKVSKKTHRLWAIVFE